MRLYVWLFVLTLSGCASGLHQNLAKLRNGMDKDEVLSQAGDPRRTFRTNSQDHWIYVFHKEDQEWLQQVDFAEGKVVNIGRPQAKKAASTSELEDADSMEEYERRARARAQKNRGG